jgi:hypothetical protein
MICQICKKEIFAGDVVKEQGGPHVLCSDPDITKHLRLLRQDGEGLKFGFLDEKGNEIWL